MSAGRSSSVTLAKFDDERRVGLEAPHQALGVGHAALVGGGGSSAMAGRLERGASAASAGGSATGAALSGGCWCA